MEVTEVLIKPHLDNNLHIPQDALRENTRHVKHAQHMSPNPTYNMRLFKKHYSGLSHSLGSGQNLWCKTGELNRLQGENTSEGVKHLSLLGICQWAVSLLHL